MKTNYAVRLENYLANLPNKVGKRNALLISEFAKTYSALPSEPSEIRIYNQVQRLASICKFLNGKELDALEMQDLENLNLAMRERKMKSSRDYRKVLKTFYRLRDKKRFFELIDSPLLKNVRKKAKETERYVDASTFWSQSELERFLKESAKYSARQGCFAAVMISGGLRPHEALALRKNDIHFEEKSEQLSIHVPEDTKTGKRDIFLNGEEALGAWFYISPWTISVKDNNALFDYSYEFALRIHYKICERAEIPETKNRNFYVFRKMALSKFYDTLGMVRGSMFAGHVINSFEARQYVGMTKEQLQGKVLATIQSKVCPSCGKTAMPHESHCEACQSPLDREKFQTILKKNLDELIDAKLEALAAQLENKYGQRRR